MKQFFDLFLALIELVIDFVRQYSRESIMDKMAEHLSKNMNTNSGCRKYLEFGSYLVKRLLYPRQPSEWIALSISSFPR